MQILVAILLLVIAFAVCWQVFSRYVSASSSAWTSELASMSFVWLAMFAIALGVRRGRHMKLDIWEYLPYRRWLTRTIDAIAALAICLVLGLLIWFGFEMLGPAFRRVQPGLGISFGWVALAVPVGCLLSLVFAVEAWWKVFRAPRGSEVLAEPILFQEPEAVRPATEGI